MPDCIALDRYKQMTGEILGASRWFPVDQQRIDRFADVTEDVQFIHVDPEAARNTPFGGTIAHGFLTLSLLSAMAMDAMPSVEGAVMGINFGFNSVRFLSPVPSGKSVRAEFRLVDFRERAPGQWQSTSAVTVQIEGEERPALIAEWLTLNIIPQAPETT